LIASLVGVIELAKAQSNKLPPSWSAEGQTKLIWWWPMLSCSTLRRSFTRKEQGEMDKPITSFISASLTDSDKFLLSEIARQDEEQTGVSSNMSATIRRLIRQEARRRRINPEMADAA
jgi:hypothetical protein